MFKIFPAAAKDHPLVKWKTEASDDPEVHKLWQNLFRDRIKYWCIPCGKINGIYALDVDVKGNGFETLKSYPQLPNTMWQYTPSGGAHFIFKYPTDGRHYGNRVKFLPGLDTRSDGGYIVSYGINESELSDAPPWLCDAAAQVLNEPQGPQSALKVDPSIAQNVILKSLDAIREAPEGESNNVLNTEAFKVGQLVAAGSITKEYAEEALLQAAIERGKPRYEAQATIASGLSGGSKKPLASPFGDKPPVPLFEIPAPPMVVRWTPNLFDTADLLNTSKLRRPQLFENWSTEDIHITTADGGTGKTTMKLFEAVCLALGERFLGFRCLSPGPTLFITGEDTDKKLAAILGQILRQMGLLEDPQYDEQVKTVLKSVFVKKDADLCLIVKDRQGFLSPNGDAMRKLTEAIDDIRPKMIVFDPISSFWGSESMLNDMNKAVTKFMSWLTEYSGACVEMINHMGKQSSSQKDMTQFAGRGGTGLPSNARVSRALRTVFDDEYTELTGGESLQEKQSAMLCNVNKFTDGSPLYNKPFLILRDGYLFVRKNMSDTKIREAEKGLSDAARVFQFIKECRHSNKFPSSKVIEAHFAVSGDPLPRAKTKRALDLLEFEGHMGEKIKLIDNPDLTAGGKVFVITDLEGRES